MINNNFRSTNEKEKAKKNEKILCFAGK